MMNSLLQMMIYRFLLQHFVFFHFDFRESHWISLWRDGPWPMSNICPTLPYQGSTGQPIVVLVVLIFKDQRMKLPNHHITTMDLMLDTLSTWDPFCWITSHWEDTLSTWDPFNGNPFGMTTIFMSMTVKWIPFSVDFQQLNSELRTNTPKGQVPIQRSVP